MCRGAVGAYNTICAYRKTNRIIGSMIFELPDRQFPDGLFFEKNRSTNNVYETRLSVQTDFQIKIF